MEDIKEKTADEMKILESLKKYLQAEIDYGEYKIICGEETIKTDDCINAIENLLKRYKELEELNKGLIESNKEWLKHYSILETESEILKAENEQYKKQFEDIKNNILVPSITEKKFIPISVIQNTLKEIDNRNYNDYTNNQDGNEVKNNILKDIQELLEERR